MKLLSDPPRCRWCNLRNPLYVRYHDMEWGIPVFDDCKLHEMLLLETFQAGLSWQCVLGKREAMRKAMDGFSAETIAQYTQADVSRLMDDEGIIRNRLKIVAAIGNARVFLAIQREWGSFLAYLKRWAGDGVRREVGLTRSPLSDAISRDLRQRGMKFVGSITIYAYLQAVGFINGHDPHCFLSGEAAGWVEGNSQ